MPHQNYRYDPLYRVIDETNEMRLIEGHYKANFERLKRINSLGVIPEVIEMAKYSKYEHSIGTVYQINCLIDIVDRIDKKYHIPLRIAAEFLHLGHFPYTYSTEKGLLIACYIGNSEKIKRDRQKIESLIKKIVEYHEISQPEKEKIITDIFSLRDFSRLYKFFSTDFFLHHSTILNEFVDKESIDLCKKIIVNNLTNEKSDGYQFLCLADKTDFVQRDALYFGTVKLDISPKHLYRKASENITIPSNEEALIDANYDYLKNTFYDDTNVLLFSRLYEKIIAALLLDEKFELDWLLQYDDDSFKWLLTNKKTKEKNDEVDLPTEWINKAKLLFERKLKFRLVFDIEAIEYEKNKDIIQIEHELIGKTQPIINLLSYPFETGILISADYLDEDFEQLNRQSVSMKIFQKNDQKDLTDLLIVIKNLNINLYFDNFQTVREGFGRLLSHSATCRINNLPVIRAIAQAIIKIDQEDKAPLQFFNRFIQSLTKVSGYEDLWNSSSVTFWKNLISESLPKEMQKAEFDKLSAYQNIIEGIFSLPSQLLQSDSSLEFLKRINDTLLKMINEINDQGERGRIFESLCLIEQLQTRKGIYQFFINGLIITNLDKKPDKQDDNEFDIVEFVLNNENKAELWIYVCSIADDIESINQNSLTNFVDFIGRQYPDLTIRTRYLIPTNKKERKWEPQEIDARRNVH